MYGYTRKPQQHTVSMTIGKSATLCLQSGVFFVNMILLQWYNAGAVNHKLLMDG